MLSVLLMNPKIITSIQQKHGLQFQLINLSIHELIHATDGIHATDKGKNTLFQILYST